MLQERAIRERMRLAMAAAEKGDEGESRRA